MIRGDCGFAELCVGARPDFPQRRAASENELHFEPGAAPLRRCHMISAQKLKLIHVARRKLGLSEGAYREILRRHGGVESSKDLGDEGFKQVIDCMKALGFWVRRAYEQDKPRDPGDLPTIGQMKVIKHLWDDLGEYLPGAKYTPFQRAFYEKLEIATLGPQTRAEANRIIEILKVRVQRELRKATIGRTQPN